MATENLGLTQTIENIISGPGLFLNAAAAAKSYAKGGLISAAIEGVALLTTLADLLKTAFKGKQVKLMQINPESGQREELNIQGKNP